MTYRDKLQELSDLTEEKASLVLKINDDFNNSCFQEFTHWDLEKAINEHTTAANTQGQFINEMTKNGHSHDDIYRL